MNTEAKERCKYELFVEKYIGLPYTDKLVEDSKITLTYGQLVNMLCMFNEEQVGKPDSDTSGGLHLADVIGVRFAEQQLKSCNLQSVSVAKQTFLCGYAGKCGYAYIDNGSIACSKADECKHKNAR